MSSAPGQAPRRARATTKRRRQRFDEDNARPSILRGPNSKSGYGSRTRRIFQAHGLALVGQSQRLLERVLGLDARVAGPLVERVRALPRDSRSHSHGRAAGGARPSLPLREQGGADASAAMIAIDDEPQDLRAEIQFEERSDRDVNPAD